MPFLKQIARKTIPPTVLRFVADTARSLSGKRRYSSLDEEVILQRHLRGMTLENSYCVDIAASDGISQSNTYSLFKAGWEGIAVEYDSSKFARLANSYREFTSVHLVKTKVIPENVTSILKSCLCPTNFAFLSLDIDSYDYFVLDKLLEEYRPSLICAEINEKFPPPLKFAVLFDSRHVWGLDHFYGQSICKCYELCEKYKYEILELHYNNLFIMPRERNGRAPMSPEEAYETGYRNKADRKEKFPWNSDMEALLSMSHCDSVDFLRRKFEKYSGKYILE